MAIETFQRVEKKYLLNKEQYQAFIEALEKHMHPDQYGKHTISNLYFDTPNDILVRRSIEKPFYKEKLRLRSYGIPTDESKVFLEIKKKYDGIVYKRRIEMSLKEANNYIFAGKKPDKQGQIFGEIDYFLNYYEGLIPKVYLAYDRIAWAGNEDDSLRVTFDFDIRSRWYDVRLEAGDHGDYLLPENSVLMEIKVPGAFPMWMAQILNELKIYPKSFSKYGNVYKNRILDVYNSMNDNNSMNENNSLNKKREA